MAKCNNCGKRLGCSCKRRTASNGKSCCASCISSYEKSIKKKINCNDLLNDLGVILKVTAN